MACAKECSVEWFNSSRAAHDDRIATHKGQGDCTLRRGDSGTQGSVIIIRVSHPLPLAPRTIFQSGCHWTEKIIIEFKIVVLYRLTRMIGINCRSGSVGNRSQTLRKVKTQVFNTGLNVCSNIHSWTCTVNRWIDLKGQGILLSATLINKAKKKLLDGA